MPAYTSAGTSSAQPNSSVPAGPAKTYLIPDGQNQLNIGIVPKETIAYDKGIASLLTNRRFGCARCPNMIFDKRAAVVGRTLEKHVNDFHPGEKLSDLEMAAPSSYRLRRKDKKPKLRGETEVEIEGEDMEEEPLTYAEEMELLKVGNPYRMNPRDTSDPKSVPVSVPDEDFRVVNYIYPDPELYSV